MGNIRVLLYMCFQKCASALIIKRMRKKLGLVMASSLLLSGLAGCSMTGENYYTIDVYSDYIGMEADVASHGRYTVDLNSPAAMSAVGLKKVGYCYAVKGKDAKIGGMTLLDSKFNGKTSTRAPLEGHKYVFDKFAGYYNDGTAIDLSTIQSNCAVFATFKDELLDYVVTVQDAYGDHLFHERVVYGKNAKETLDQGDKSTLEELLGKVPPHDGKADPDDYSSWRDAHYFNYKFLGWKFSVEGKKASTDYTWDYDAEKNRSSVLLTVDQSKEYRFKEATRITPYYEKTYKSYTVNINYQIRTFNETLGEFEYTDPVAAAPQTITYGKPIDFDAVGLTGYTCVGEGLNDAAPSRYGDDMSIKEGELRKKLPIPLCELYKDGYRGAPVDRFSIAFGCTVNLIFSKDVPVYELSFHNDFDNPDKATVVLIQEGERFSAPGLTGTAPAGKAFADWAKKDELDHLVPVDLHDIHNSYELFPLLVDQTVVGDNGRLTFTFTPELSGYSLTQVAKDRTTVLAEDFACASIPALYPLRGVTSFDGPSGETNFKLTEINFPAVNEIRWMAHGLFASLRLSEVTSIHLATTKVLELASYAFHNLPRLAEVDLPSSLHSLGTSIFNNCTSLTKVAIDLTEAEVAARIASKEFDANWFGGFSGTIDYKAA